ncbi:MAG: hypothetical protein V4599_10035 [Verrucomicrobiota bacterium]
MIARRAGGEPVGLVRSPDEVVFLAFDASIKRLVELHILRSGRTLDSVAKKSAFERAKEASEIRGSSFMRIRDVGEDQGLVYYTSNLNDGEFIEDYIRRRGPLQPAMVFSLVFQLLDDLLHLKKYQRLVSQMRLDRVVMTTLEDTFLQLRIYDYGLSATESDASTGARLVIQVCELMFLMLTGKTYAGDNPDRFPSLTSLPMGLRTAMRTALTDPANCPTSIEKVRDDVREAIGALVSSINARNPRKQLVVIPALQPRSQLQDLLLENVPVEIILGNRFRVEDEDNARRYPFSIPCFNTKNEQPVTVHLLPPARIVEKTQYEAVPLQTWRFNADKHPNILRSLSLWESPDWTFLTEEREPGFSLSRLLAERITLNHQEVAVLLRQVHAGQEQALECGVQRLDLHPSNIMLRVGKNGPLMSRDHDRLMQKRLDAWPTFQVKLRAHLTMRNLYEPPLVEKPEQGEHVEVHLADRDYRSRAFVALAAYLLTGQRQGGIRPQFPEAMPELLADFIRECLEKSSHHGQVVSPAEFLAQYEGLMNGTSSGPDLAARLRGLSVPLEEMESVGSVSDFDNEWRDDNDADPLDDSPLAPVSRRFKPADFNRPKSQVSLGWPVWAAAAAVMLGLASWWLFSSAKPAPKVPAAPIVAEVLAEKPPAKDVPVPAPPATIPLPAPGPAVSKQVVAHKPAVTLPAPVITAAPVKAPAAETPAATDSSAPAAAQPAPVADPAPAKIKTAVAPMPGPPPPKQEAPSARPAQDPVIIRKAILPSPEEIARFKQGLANPQPAQLPVQTAPKEPANQRSGAVPTLNVAQPMPLPETAAARQ